MNCSISGEVPEEPTVSIKSGLLFEKRLISRHISDYGKCPITGEPLSLDDIVEVKAGKIVKPRPVQAASIPGMIGMFQNEWDSLMLSNFALEQQLHKARQELSHALYQHDAACRVIARLKKERDEAMSLLAQAERRIPISGAAGNALHAPALSNGKRGPEEEDLDHGGKKARVGISADIIAEMTECNLELSQQRKKRTVPPTLAPIADLELYTQISSYPLHKTSKPGILSVDIHYSKDIIATGGIDTNAIVFDRPSGQIVSTLSGHSKKVTSVKIVPQDESLIITGSADKTVRLWQGSEHGNYGCRHVLRDHTAEVQAVTVHATNKYFVTASLDNSWCFYDLASGLCLQQVLDSSGSEGYTSAAFHRQEAAAKRVHPTLHLPAAPQPTTQVAGLFASSATPGVSSAPPTSGAPTSSSTGMGFPNLLATSANTSSSSLFSTPSSSSLFSTPSSVAGSSLFTAPTASQSSPFSSSTPSLFAASTPSLFGGSTPASTPAGGSLFSTPFGSGAALGSGSSFNATNRARPRSRTSRR